MSNFLTQESELAFMESTGLNLMFFHGALVKQRDVCNVPQFFGDKTEARLAPGIFQLYSAVVYSSNYDL